MKNNRYNRPLIPLTISIIIGIVSGLKFPGFSLAVSSLAIVFLIITTIFIIKKRLLKYLPIFLFISIGYLIVQPYVDVVFSSNHIKSYAGRTKYQVTGTVESRPVKKNRRYKFILKTETITDKDEICKPVTGKIRVSIYGDKLIVKKGDRISFRSKIRLFRNFNNAGGFDYERFMAFKDIWGSAYANEKKVEIIHAAPFSPVIAAQDSVIKLIDNNISKEEVKSVLKALIVGDKQSIGTELRESFNRTGTGHLLAISGLHIGIVAGFAFWLFCYFLSFSNYLLWSGTILKYAGFLALMPVIAYGLIAGMSPSTQRAVIMVTVMLLAYSCRAEYDLVNSLALAALVILLVSPVSLFSISFQLSFMAVFAIACGILILIDTNETADNIGNLKKILSVIQKKMFSYILISFLAFAGTLPIVMYYFNQISFVGMPANFVLIPLIGFIVVPVGLMAALIYPASSVIGGILIKISGYVLEISLSIINSFSELPFASIKTITPSIVEIVCYYCMFFLAIYFFYNKNRGLKNNNRKMKIVVGVLVLVSLADLSFWINKRFLHNSLIVTLLDVGQGSSALLEFPNGECMLIDGGGFNDNSSFDVGERIIAPFLWRKKIRTIDTVVLTHPESDHLNGLLFILKHFSVRDVWSNGQKRFLKGYQEFEKIIKAKKIDHQPFEELLREHVIGGVKLDIIYPVDNFLEKQALEKWRNTNNNSLVVRAEYKNKSFLFPGDIMEKAEAELVKVAGEDLKSTVLIAPHHGSKTSGTEGFIRRVDPEYVIISAGWENRFKMPHDSVMKRLKKTGAGIFRTDKNGAVSIAVTENSFNIESNVE